VFTIFTFVIIINEKINVAFSQKKLQGHVIAIICLVGFMVYYSI